jgi:hypothetical protein
MFIQPYGSHKCICIDGPLKDKEDEIALIGPDSPCNAKWFKLSEKEFIVYYSILDLDKKCWKKDDNDRYILTYERS